MSACFEALPALPHADSLQARLQHYQHWAKAQTHQPPASPSTLLAELIAATQQALGVQSSLSALASQHAKQARLVDRLLADNARLRRENDVCLDQLFLHSVPVDGVDADLKRAMDRRGRQHGKRRRRRMATDRTTLLSGFESTDEDEEDDEEDSGADNSSQASGSASECPSRSDGHESGAELSMPSQAALSPCSTSAPFDSLIQSLATHPSIQHINSHFTHLSTLLALEATQPPQQPASPSSLACPAGDFDRTGSSTASSAALFERSTELEAVMEVRLHVQRERARRGRRVAGQLRQLAQLQSAEMAAMRQELDVLRSATHDSYTSSMARETRQLQEWMAAVAERPAIHANSRRASITSASRANEASASLDVSGLGDVQRVCGLLDGVMRHVHDSGVRSQSYVEHVKRLYDEQSRRGSTAVDTAS